MVATVLFSLILLFAGCSSGDDPSEPVPGQKGEPVEGIRIAWDYNSMQRLAPLGERSLFWAGYPRVRRLNDGTLMAVYETEGNGEMVYSKDNGKTWNGPFVTFKKHTFTNNKGKSTDINIANSELTQLQNGNLIMACNYRPVTYEIAPFAIAVRRSTDMGQSWTADQVIYEGGPRFTDGCWEPAFLQLPNGELQVYFANEAPFLTSDEQNISMISSSDNGITWSNEVKTVSFRVGRRDGMPVPFLVDDEILVAIEDNKIGQFKPYIVRSKISDNWSSPVLADSPNREYALKQPLPDEVYAGAPYLMGVPSGEVVLSYQTTGGRTSDWERSTMEVAIGDHTGRDFEKLTRPFLVPLDREAKWNSVSLWDEKTVVAASTTSFRSPNCEVWIIKGHIIPELEAVQSGITVDGNISDSEWGNDFSLFIGHRSETNLRSNIRYDGQNLYFCAIVEDKKLISDKNDPVRSDGVYLYIDSENSSLLSPSAGMFRIWCNCKGKMTVEEGNNGKWTAITSDHINAVTVNTGSGYQVEFEVPFSVLKKNNRSDIRINLGLVEYSDVDSWYEENIVNTVPASSNTWCRVTFK
ncbi:MAG: exo-alpha-sialidase [Mangrovibacterium sp.]